MEARSDQLAHAPALHPAFYRAIHPVAVIRRVRALVAVYQDGDCPEEFPALVRSVCPALPVEFPEARSASCFALAGIFVSDNVPHTAMFRTAKMELKHNGH